MMNKIYEFLGIAIVFINPWFVLKHKDLILETAASDGSASRESVEEAFEQLIDRAIVIRAVVLGILGAILLSNIVFMLRY